MYADMDAADGIDRLVKWASFLGIPTSMAENSAPFGTICRRLRCIFHFPVVGQLCWFIWYFSSVVFPVHVDAVSPTQTRNYDVYSRRQGLNAC